MASPTASADDAELSSIHRQPSEPVFAPLTAESAIVPPSDGDIEQQKVSDADEETTYAYPDGGLRAWLNVASAVAAYWVSWGVVVSFGAFQAYLGGTLDASASAISWTGSVQIFCLMATGCIVGRLFDRGYSAALMWTGTALFALCAFLLELCTELWQIVLTLGIGVGLAQGLIFLPAIACVGQYFKVRRNLALGITAVGSSLGAIILPIQLQHMFASNGWATATRTFAAINTALLIFASLCIRPRLPAKVEGPLFSLRVFANRSFLLYTIGVCIIELGFYIPYYFLPDRAMLAGASPRIAYSMVAFAGAGSFFGRIFPLWLADSIGIMTVMVTVLLGASVLQLVWIACDTVASLIVFSVLYGFFSGAYVAGLPAAVAPLTPDMRDYGLYNGVLFFVAAFFALIGSPIGGALLDVSVAGAAGFGGGAMLLGTVFVGAVWWRERRRHGTWRV